MLCVLTVLVDTFETVVLPRTVKRPIRLTNIFFWLSQRVYKQIERRVPESRRKSFLAAYAPLSLFALFTFWALLLIFGFACISFGLRLPFASGSGVFTNRLYFSGVTFFTLGFGDLTPADNVGKTLAVVECGTGFGFLAVVIGYVPVFYNAFSRREVTMILLDSKAGSDPTGSEIIRRHAEAKCMDQLPVLLKEWELFAAQLLEVYLSYPILAFYRSQHDDQSWLRSTCAVMDACTICITGFEDEQPYTAHLVFQAKATFAMARHLIVDFAYVLNADPKPLKNRTSANLDQLYLDMDRLKLPLDRSPEAAKRFEVTCALYEPFIGGLAERLKMEPPLWCLHHRELDNWQTSAWDGKHF